MRAIGRELLDAGGVIQTDMPVTGIEIRNQRVTGVHTTAGTIHTACIVNAAGAWAGVIV